MHNDADEVKLELARLTNAIEDNLALPGRELSDAIDYGCILSGGEVDASGRRWIYVLATNDAAEDLERWAAEQVAGRREAAHRAGITFIDVIRP